MDEVERVFDLFQSPYDKKQWKQYKQRERKKSVNGSCRSPKKSLSDSASKKSLSSSSTDCSLPTTPNSPSTPCDAEKHSKSKPKTGRSERGKYHRKRRHLYSDEAIDDYSYSLAVVRNNDD
mmetsp:Transcript_41335/g.66486  ORF Transcript_41335/g.66486 Transcript_41335/m.66486 type:complete len:121 (+) Transcript_41335:1-363(+)